MLASRRRGAARMAGGRVRILSPTVVAHIFGEKAMVALSPWSQGESGQPTVDRRRCIVTHCATVHSRRAAARQSYEYTL